MVMVREKVVPTPNGEMYSVYCLIIELLINFLPDYVYDLYFTKEPGAVDMETATL